MPEDQIFDQETRNEIPVESYTPEPPRSWQGFFRDKKVWAGLGVALVAIGVIFWFFLSRSPGQPKTTSSNVILLVKGPDQLSSDNETEYTIVYRNGENADMTNVSLEMFYPTGFKFKSADPAPVSSTGQRFNLPLVKEGKDGQVLIRGKLSGGTGEDKEIRAKLHYSLSNFNSEFVVEQSIHTSILPPNLTVEVTGPVDVVNGQDATLAVNFTNVSQQDFADLALQLTYPAGFVFTAAQPAASKGNNYWKLPVLATGHASTVSITGSFTGDPNSEKLVKAELGKIINNTFAPLVASTSTFKIIPSSLSLTVEANPSSVIKLGDTINYKLHYANRGTIGLSNLVITVNLDGPVLELSRISAPNAIITGKTVTWKAATLSNLTILSPNEQGDITFSVPVKSSLSTNLKNLSVTASAAISSNEITQATKAVPLQLNLASALTLDLSGRYVSGAAPMKVDQTTVFEITFLLSNLSNDLTGTQVVASLPLPASAWKNVVLPESEKERLTYDPNSGKITWRIGDLAAFVGKFTPVLRTSFQLAVTPTAADQGKTMKLLGDIQASGTDSFVSQMILSEKVTTFTVSDLEDDVLDDSGTTVE